MGNHARRQDLELRADGLAVLTLWDGFGSGVGCLGCREDDELQRRAVYAAKAEAYVALHERIAFYPAGL
jgi:hypothetical protein